MTDLLVIGGGAAGLMAAGAACARGLTVTVLEHNPKGPGQKLLITGKGRCNVTSDSDVREFLPYVRHNGRFLYSSLYAFPPSAAMELFESLGVPLKTARGRRVFPRSDRAADVLAALRDYARDAEFVRGSRCAQRHGQDLPDRQCGAAPAPCKGWPGRGADPRTLPPCWPTSAARLQDSHRAVARSNRPTTPFLVDTSSIGLQEAPICASAFDSCAHLKGWQWRILDSAAPSSRVAQDGMGARMMGGKSAVKHQ